MQKDLQSKFEAYQKEQATLADAVKQSREQEMQDLNQRIDQFQLKSQQDMQKKREELMSPILEKVQAAIKTVADANNYTYRSEEHTSELQSLMRISYAVFCLKKKKNP